MKGQLNLKYVICTTVLILFILHGSNGKKYTKIFVPEMIVKEGFPFEEHLVTTEDGYILTLHRIPGPPGSTPVFIQHGLLESSTDFLYNGKNGSIAFLLHQRGYDVWLGNARGNIYSTLHTNYTRSDPEYWDFSTTYDNPAAISHIHNTTNQKVFYIGHSMGCTSFAVMAIARPDIAQNIKAMFALAPAVYATYNKQPGFVAASHFWKVLLFLNDLVKFHQIGGRNPLFDFIADRLCPLPVLKSALCENVLFFIGGYNQPELPKNLMAKLYSKLPAGTSMKVFIHYFQQERVPKLRRFDYGSKKKNLERYGASEPPEYDTSSIQVPVAVFYSHNDWLVGAKDAERFYNEVPNKLGLYPIEPYTHFDFLLGIHAPERVYSTIFKLMSQFE